MNSEQWLAKYESKAGEWVTKDGEARRLEKLEKVIFSEIVNQAEGPISKAEHAARGSEAYRKHVLEMVQARTDANAVKAELEGMDKKWETWRTLQATRRAEMKLV